MYSKPTRIFCVLFSWLQLLLVSTIAENLARNRLDHYIQHYEVLDYDPVSVHESHLRVKRWAENPEAEADGLDEPDIYVNFNSHGRNFELRLKRDTKTFGESIEIQSGNRTGTLRHSNLVEGHLQDDDQSKVFGSIQDGIFHGHIFTPKESFSIERSSRFAVLNEDASRRNTSQHSVIYSHNDIENEHEGNNHHHGCGVNEETLEWMSNIQNAAVVEDDIARQTHYYGNQNSPIYHSNHSIIQSLIRESNHPIRPRSARTKRDATKTAEGSSKNAGIVNSKTTCSLYVTTDPTLWRQIVKQEGTSDKNKIREIIISMVGQHVKAVNEIFQNTVFQSFRNIRFEVRKVKIDMVEECDPGRIGGVVNPFCEEHIDVSNFLDLHSKSNHESFCLSYAFAYRDFSGGVVGLAWVGSTTSGGGICQKHTRYLEGTALKQRSLNTGIVTFLNYNRQLPPKLSQLTLAHEIGHSFGAPHDPDDDGCQPGGLNGNYIMYASSTNGYLTNNAKFSSCSINSIAPILNQVFNTNQKENCFSDTDGAFCGNRIVEEGEECDCGIDEECTEACCFKGPTNVKKSCTRNQDADCSPSEGPCCKPESCGFIQNHEHLSCRREGDCTEESFCNGNSAQCPLPAFKQDHTVCNNGTQVCLEGECKGSICLNFRLTECYLSSSEYSDKRALCNVSCEDGYGQCRSTYDLNMAGVSRTLSLRPGSPCDNFKGYCDVFLKCRAVDEEGPLLRLKRLILNKHGFRTLHEWARANWWAVILMALGFLILMALFIKCFAVHTPSSNPYLAKNVKISDTLRRPINSLKKQPKRTRPPDYDDVTNRETYPLRDMR